MKDRIDPAAGILLYRKVGEEIGRGELLAKFCGSKELEEGEERLKGAVQIGAEKADPPCLIRKTIELRGRGGS